MPRKGWITSGKMVCAFTGGGEWCGCLCVAHYLIVHHCFHITVFTSQHSSQHITLITVFTSHHSSHHSLHHSLHHITLITHHITYITSHTSLKAQHLLQHITSIPSPSHFEGATPITRIMFTPNSFRYPNSVIADANVPNPTHHPKPPLLRFDPRAKDATCMLYITTFDNPESANESLLDKESFRVRR